MHRTWIAAIAAPILLLAFGARADVAPDPGDCTVSYYETDERDCERCAPDECDAQFEGTDFSRQCYGPREDETYDPEYEIWCETAPWGLGPNCSTASTTLLPPSAGLALLALGGAALWWTRRR